MMTLNREWLSSKTTAGLAVIGYPSLLHSLFFVASTGLLADLQSLTVEHRAQPRDQPQLVAA